MKDAPGWPAAGRALVIGATGTIGSAVTQRLRERYDVITASRRGADIEVDLSDPESLRRLFMVASDLHAVVCAVGVAAYGPFFELTDEDFRLSLGNKIMGQVNLVRYGISAVLDGGSFTLTGGLGGRFPMEEGGAAIGLCNAALEGCVKAAAKEMRRGIRLNVVAPGWVKETRVALKLDPSIGWPAEAVAAKYLETVTGRMTGEIIDAG